MPGQDARVNILTVVRIMVGFVYAVLIVYLVILTIGFFLQLFGANPSADFANWIYNAEDRIMEPFRGIFPTTAITDRAVFNASVLFAMIIYGMFALAVHALMTWLGAQIAKLRAQTARDNTYDTSPPPGISAR